VAIVINELREVLTFSFLHGSLIDDKAEHSTAGILGTNKRENFLDAFSKLFLTLSTATHSISLVEVHSLFQPHLSLPVHSSCPPAYCVSPLLIIITCFFSLLVSLPFTHCLQLHTYSHTDNREGRQGGGGMG